MPSALTPVMLFVSSFFGCTTPEIEPTTSGDFASKELLGSFNELPDSCAVSTDGTAKKLECDGLPNSYFLAHCDYNTAAVNYPSDGGPDDSYGYEKFGLTADIGVTAFSSAPYAAKLFALPALCGKEPATEQVVTSESKKTIYVPLNSRWR